MGGFRRQLILAFGLWLVIALVISLVVACAAGSVDEPAPESSSPTLILATTTSTYDSGLLDFILPDFEAKHDVTVDVVSVGTGQALKLGEDGNADVVLVHARSREDEFMAAGHGIRREDVMANDFVLIGPVDDPAGIGGGADAAAALAAVAGSGAMFVSRGDDSGTHIRELVLWSAADVDPNSVENGEDWYNSAGQGMGAVLTIADELQAYTLSDRSTYLKRIDSGLSLAVLVEGDERLLNPYGVMVVNPEKGSHIQDELANSFVDWLISESTKEMIGSYGIEQFGDPLFFSAIAPRD